MMGTTVKWNGLHRQRSNVRVFQAEIMNIFKKFIIIPWMPDEIFYTRESCLNFARRLTWIADVLALHGMVTGYHNHGTEFRPTDDTKELPWDLIA